MGRPARHFASLPTLWICEDVLALRTRMGSTFAVYALDSMQLACCSDQWPAHH